MMDWENMSTIKPIFLVSALLVPAFAMADTAPFTTSISNVEEALGVQQAQAVVKNGVTTVTSPRTGISYTLGKTEGRPITLQTEAIVPVNNVTVKRIIATNPALSTESQETAEKLLLEMPSEPQTVAQAQ